jgi:HlyD family secretion protein
MFKNRKIQIGLAAILLIIVVLFFSSRNKEELIEVTTISVERKNLSSKVVADGILQPETEVKLSANNTTYITDIAVKEGDKVRKGDFLMSLDEEQQRAQTEASRASLDAAKVQLDQRASQQKRQNKLYEQGLISDQEMEATNSSYASALSAFNNAKSRLIMDEDSLSKLRLIAPQDGTITFVEGEIGDLAQGGMFNPRVLIKLADLNQMEVNVNVNENDIAEIEINDSAIVEVDAFKDKKFKGIVKEVAYASTTSSGGSQQQVTNFEVKIQMLEVVDGMRPGMSATVEIITEEREGALSIPIQSLTTPRPKPSKEKKSRLKVETASSGQRPNFSMMRGGSNQPKSTVVFVYGNNVVEQRNVKVGIVGERDYEVIEGLEEGEQVVSGSFVAISRELYDGAKVQLKESQNFNRRNRE